MNLYFVVMTKVGTFLTIVLLVGCVIGTIQIVNTLRDDSADTIHVPEYNPDSLVITIPTPPGIDKNCWEKGLALKEKVDIYYSSKPEEPTGLIPEHEEIQDGFNELCEECKEALEYIFGVNICQEIEDSPYDWTAIIKP